MALRQRKFEGSIAIIGDEVEPPYERPPLSKEYLGGAKSFERILIRPTGFWTERNIDLLLGRSVIDVEPEAHHVRTSDGSVFGYGQLVWAAGGTPRRLSCLGHDLLGVHSVRSRADVDRLKEELDRAHHVVVVGGGYIGLEAAAMLSKFGKTITVIEAQDRVLARVAGEPLSRFFEQEHRSHGVEIRLAAVVDHLEGNGGWVSGVRLVDGELIQADMVIVGIGIIPAVAPLLAAGADGGNGVVVDAACRTSLPDIFAIGDCAAHINIFSGISIPIRVESVQNANDQALVVAKTLTGETSSYEAIPWFWSNQYDLRLQTVGLSTGYDQVIVRGTLTSRSLSFVYLRGGRVIALDCVNATKDYVQGRALVLGAAQIDPARLEDVNTPLKEMVVALDPGNAVPN